MTRRNGSKQNKRSNNEYRLQYVTMTRQDIQDMAAWSSFDQTSTAERIASVIDHGWKMSISQHEGTGRYLVSLTSKSNLRTPDHIVYIIEHEDFRKGVWAGEFLVVHELIGNGDIEVIGNFDW